EGNRTSKTETATGKVEEYTWDYRNRLTKVVFRNSSGGAIVKQVDYEYDPYNRLVHRTFDADGAGSGAATDQFWVYDEGINAVLQFDGPSASNLSHRYLWSNNVDELLADEQIAGSNTLWGLADHLGSLRDIADLNEGTGVTSITNHRTFNSFGKLISETNAAVDMLFAFTGKQYDEATALQHNLYRWYDPILGQWLNEDPLSFAAGDSNLVRYVSNTPNNKLDCMGLDENEYSDRMQTYRRNQAIQCHQSDAQNNPFSYSDYQTFMSTLNSWLQDEAERRQNSQTETMKEIEVRVRAAIADSRRNSHLSIPENVWYSVAWGNGNQGPCYEFAERAQQEIEAKTEAFVREHAYICVRRVEWHFGWRPWRPASGHHGIRLDIYDADGNLYKSLYFDNGWLGGSDGVFENDEIPSDYSSPNDAPADKTIFPPWKF
ncbi:MAG: RHS repeat-associated core domain-containing protein, partial [Planctomycetota bacterium]